MKNDNASANIQEDKNEKNIELEHCQQRTKWESEAVENGNEGTRMFSLLATQPSPVMPIIPCKTIQKGFFKESKIMLIKLLLCKLPNGPKGHDTSVVTLYLLRIKTNQAI